MTYNPQMNISLRNMKWILMFLIFVILDLDNGRGTQDPLTCQWQGGTRQLGRSIHQHCTSAFWERSSWKGQPPPTEYNVFLHRECVPIKLTFKRLELRCTRSITSSRHPSQLDLDKLVSGTYLGRFLSRLSRIKRSQVMSSHGKMGCTQFWLGFLGFSSILKVTFLTHCP